MSSAGATLLSALALVILPTSGATVFSEGITLSVTREQIWLPLALISPAAIEATACDAGGELVQLVLHVDGHDPVTANGPSECLTTTLLVDQNIPGTLRAKATAEDMAGSKRSVVGGIQLTLLPFNPSDLPGLDEVNEPVIGPSARIDVLLNASGSVRASRVVVGGVTHHDDYTTTAPNTGDHDVAVSFNPRFGTARFQMDENVIWSGLTTQAGLKWWQIAPVGDIGLIPEPLSSSP